MIAVRKIYLNKFTIATDCCKDHASRFHDEFLNITFKLVPKISYCKVLPGAIFRLEMLDLKFLCRNLRWLLMKKQLKKFCLVFIFKIE